MIDMPKKIKIHHILCLVGVIQSNFKNIYYIMKFHQLLILKILYYTDCKMHSLEKMCIFSANTFHCYFCCN